MLLEIILFRFFVTSFDHHTPFNALIIFRACVTPWHILLVSLPCLVNTDPRTRFIIFLNCVKYCAFSLLNRLCHLRLDNYTSRIRSVGSVAYLDIF